MINQVLKTSEIYPALLLEHWQRSSRIVPPLRCKWFLINAHSKIVPIASLLSEFSFIPKHPLHYMHCLLFSTVIAYTSVASLVQQTNHWHVFLKGSGPTVFVALNSYFTYLYHLVWITCSYCNCRYVAFYALINRESLNISTKHNYWCTIEVLLNLHFFGQIITLKKNITLNHDKGLASLR